VRVPNESESEIGGAFAELLRIQTEFQTRLTEETLTHLRRLQGAAMPVAPTTVLMPGGVSELSAAGSPGTPIKLELELENRQRVYCIVTPMLSPLVENSGITWFPSVAPMTLLLAPDEIAPLSISTVLPAEMPVGVYRGALMLQGFRAAAIAVSIQVERAAPTRTSRKAAGARRVKANSAASGTAEGSPGASTAKKRVAARTKKGRRRSRKSS